LALSPANSCASLPFGQRSRPRLGSQRSLRLRRLEIATNPLTPSTIARRVSSMLAPTRAMRTPRRPVASRWIHSAPARVLPNPRPAIISQVRQPSAGGSSWLVCAQFSKSASNIIASYADISLMILRRSSSLRAVSIRIDCLAKS
jgi:hypothetical protein